ncbi:hypothetical protein HII31_11152 [Pseudocercospora fuligena]|uniref:F-box domain-containing protein n=1 Tax=Pseudocercospora fuligena TaxID=685502 RepID=A0A8H6VCT5_9PEZI|nr:hypothetical protein HII31_11152 [Pseudocercospora fuligena]
MASNPLSAGARVVGTFELLEQILSEALKQEIRSHENHEYRTVLASQRVSRAFRDTIANSPHLQRELWFAAPIPHPESPIVRHHFNPMITWEVISLSDGTSLRIRIGGWVEGFRIAMRRDGQPSPASQLLSASKHGSWRRMYLSSHEYVVDHVEASDYDGMPHKKVEKKLHSPTAGQLDDARVANTFELLERILLDTVHSPPSDTRSAAMEGMWTILLSQRVCKAFRDTIANSPPLQRQLYLAAPSEQSEDGTLNPLFCQPFQIAEGLKLEVRADAWWEFRSPACDWEVDFRYARTAPLKQSHHPAVEESWRKMYLLKGPYEVATVMALGGHNRSVTGRARSPTVGKLFDAVFLKGHQLSSIGRDRKEVNSHEVEDWPSWADTGFR